MVDRLAMARLFFKATDHSSNVLASRLEEHDWLKFVNDASLSIIGKP